MVGMMVSVEGEGSRGIQSFTHHRRTDWTRPSTVGDGNPTAAPQIPCCPVLWNAPVPWSHQGTWFIRKKIRKQAPGCGAALLTVSLGHHPAPKALDALSPASSWDVTAAMAQFLQALECPQLLISHRSRRPWDVQDSEQQGTRSVSVRLLPTLGFFITRTPRCSWLWEVFCPHTK